MLVPRLELDRKLGGKEIAIWTASDCTGGGAPEQAWRSVGRVLETLCIAKVNIKEVFGSEHPKAYHCIRYLQNNMSLSVLFVDVVKRAIDMLNGQSEFETTDGNAELPPRGQISNYSCGFECQDRCFY